MSKGINNDWSLIGKYLSGEATLSEKTEVEEELATSDEFRKEFEESKGMMEKVDSFYQSKKFNSSSAWTKIAPSIQAENLQIMKVVKSKTSLIKGIYRYAALIIILLTLGVAAYYTINQHQSDQEFYEITTSENEVLKNYILPDGSNVTLNSSTKLKYAKNFEKNIREVFITGEAFFDVTRNPEKPFVIHAGDAQVKVLGTSFNVCAYPTDKLIEVLVETGKVEVSKNTNEPNKKELLVILNPGEKGILFPEKNTIEKIINKDKNLLAWKTGILEFNETPLADVIKNLQKIYHINIDVEQNDINNLVLTARFDDKPAQFILDVVRLTFDLNLSKSNDLYVLSKKLEPEKL